MEKNVGGEWISWIM